MSAQAARIYLRTTSERDRVVAAALNKHVRWPIGHVAGTRTEISGEGEEQKNP